METNEDALKGKNYNYIKQIFGLKFAKLHKKYEKVKTHIDENCLFRFANIISETELNLYVKHRFFNVDIQEENDKVVVTNINSEHGFINNMVVVLKDVSDKNMYDGYGAIFKIKATSLKISVINDPDEGKHEKAINIIKELELDTKLKFELADY